MRHQENNAEPPLKAQTGWFSFHRDRKTTPASLSKDASRNFLCRFGHTSLR